MPACRSHASQQFADAERLVHEIVGAKALASGEVGFGYIMNSPTDGQSTSGNSRRPLLVAGITLGGGGTTAPSDAKPGLATGALGGGGAAGGVRDVLGDINVFNGKAVVLYLDNSAVQETIRPTDKKILNASLKGLLQTGEDTPWGTDISPVLIKPKSK